MLEPVVVVVECFAVYAYNLCGNLSVLGPKVHCWASLQYCWVIRSFVKSSIE